MSDPATIALSAACLALAVAVVVLVVKQIGLLDDVKGSLAAEALATRAQQVAEDGRDAALAQSARDAATTKDALAQLAAAQLAANADAKELENHVADEIAKGTPADAARRIDELLAVPGPGAAAAAAAGDDHGQPGAAAVQPATVAEAGNPGRRP